MQLLLLASLAQASSYYFLDSGTRAIGRGGAYIVGADDLSAQYYNPAALINIDRPQLNLNVWTVGQGVKFDRADEAGEDGVLGTGDDYVYSEVTNEAPWIIEPTLGFATPVGKQSDDFKTVVALGLYLPSSPNMAYSETGAQRYSLINSLVWQVYAGPSIAQQLTKYVTVGAGLQYTFLRVDQTIASMAVISGQDVMGGSDVTGVNDITIDIKSWDQFELSWNAGLLVHPTEWMQIGASVQPAIGYEAPGSMTSTFNPQHIFLGQLASDTFTDDDITLLVKVPWIVRGGVQVEPTANSRIELSGTWTDWSSLQELRVTDVDLLLEHDPDSALLTEDLTVTDDVVLKTGFVDAFSVRLGGDVTPKPWVTARAGVHYESSAIPTAYQGQSIVDGPKAGLGLGATFRVGKRLALDAAFAEQIIFPREITDSEVTAVVVEAEVVPPYPTYIKEGKVIGNGTLKSNVTFAGVGATVFFGAGGE